MRRPTNRLLFGQKAIEKLPVPKSGRVHHYDAKVRDLGLRVEPSGRKSFFWFKKVQGRPMFRAVGTFPATSVEQARGRAHELSGKLDVLKRNGFKGENFFERRRSEPTLGELLEDYIDRHLKQKAKRPEAAEARARWIFDTYLAGWRARKLGAIRRKEDVSALHAEIGEKHHTIANRVIQLLRAMFNFARSPDAELWTGENPAAKIKRFHGQPRDRFVQPDEMPRLFAALRKEPNRDFVDFVNLSLWTGARKSDVLSMRWQDVSLGDNRWSVPDPKADPYTVALTPEAVKILKDRLRTRRADNPWVFPSFGKTGHVVDLKGRWKALLGRAGVTNLRQHDMRRTLGSWMAGAGVSLPIIGKSLGHKSIAATSIYARINIDPVRQAVTAATAAMIAASKKRPKMLKAATGE